ncbi:MAG: hypothetical protein OXF73_09580 [Gammaproteobacteria bacterium]|nr:hypothetical protein [Gammaproteobacteria bacterium]
MHKIDRQLACDERCRIKALLKELDEGRTIPRYSFWHDSRASNFPDYGNGSVMVHARPVGSPIPPGLEGRLGICRGRSGRLAENRRNATWRPDQGALRRAGEVENRALNASPR